MGTSNRLLPACNLQLIFRCHSDACSQKLAIENLQAAWHSKKLNLQASQAAGPLARRNASRCKTDCANQSSASLSVLSQIALVVKCSESSWQRLLTHGFSQVSSGAARGGKLPGPPFALQPWGYRLTSVNQRCGSSLHAPIAARLILQTGGLSVQTFSHTSRLCLLIFLRKVNSGSA